MDLLTRIKRTVDTYPDHTAYLVSSGSLTYRQLWQQAVRMADLLARQGSSPVALYGHKEPEMAVAMLACLLAKRAYVPIAAGTPTVRVEQMLNLAGAGLLVQMQPFHSRSVPCLRPEELDVFSGDPVQKSSNQTAYIIFTSGSTGSPKGVPVTRANLDHFGKWIYTLPVLDRLEPTRVLNQANFSFDLSVADFYYTLQGGHTLVALEDLNDAARLFQEQQIGVGVLTPTFLRFCLLDPDFNQSHCPHLRCIYLCGERLETSVAARLRRAFPNIAVLNAYGPTEATSAVSAALITDEMLDWSLLPVGEKKLLAVDIQIENEELVLYGPSVAPGYLNGIREGFFSSEKGAGYRTGDLGYWKNDLLFCTGRRDLQLKLKGYRVEPGEIESCLSCLPGVAECAVVPGIIGGEICMLKAFVVPDEGFDPAKTQAALKARLPFYMVPRQLRILNRLPRTPNQKIDRRQLMEL